jgi:hypothetical protein
MIARRIAVIAATGLVLTPQLAGAARARLVAPAAVATATPKLTFSQRREQAAIRRANRLEARTLFDQWIQDEPGLKHMYAGSKWSQGVGFFEGMGTVLTGLSGAMVYEGIKLDSPIGAAFWGATLGGVGLTAWARVAWFRDQARGQVVKNARALGVKVPPKLLQKMQLAGSFGIQ